jgi:hypothetical protein
MIWEQTTTRRPSSPTSARETLAEEIRSLCVSAGILESQELREFSAGVAWHAADLPARPTAGGDLSRLTARAFGSLGRPDAARRVLVLGSGLVRPADWLAAHPRAVWTLDLERLMSKEGDHLELALFRGLSVILNAMADLWTSTSGSGLLGLRRASPTVRLILGSGASPEAVQSLRREIRGFCSARLASLASERGWDAFPRVLFTEPETP